MRLLITGGLGFIGSNFVHYVLDNKSEVEVLVNLDVITYAGNPMNVSIVEANPKYVFVKGNITNFELVDYVVKKYNITHIINFAAESHVDRSISNPNIFVETNVIGTQTLLNVAKSNPAVERYLQVSTDEVYGSLGFEDPAFTEENPICPRSPYSASKASADMLVLAYNHTFNLPVLITRCSNNYGAYQFPEKLIPLMIHNIQNDKKLPVYGDGSNVRDWIHVLDHCAGIYDTLTKGQVGEVYNFGGNAELSNIELVKLLLKKLNKGEDLITFVKDRPGHDLRYAMDFSKSTKELGWNPEYTFEQGIQETIDWYLSNEEWVKNITSGEYKNYILKHYGAL
jgi:dTDP-glucose 4,6-dehydratase